MMLARSAAIWRELDVIRVVGREQPLAIFEPIEEAEDHDAVAIVNAYAEGLRHWRAGEFGEAAKAFSRFADVDPPASRLQERSLKFGQDPPGADWSAVHVLESK